MYFSPESTIHSYTRNATVTRFDRSAIPYTRRETKALTGTKLALVNIFACKLEVSGNSLGCLDDRIQGIDYAYKGDLFDAVGIFTNMFPDEVVYVCFVLFAGALDEEIAGL